MAPTPAVLYQLVGPAGAICLQLQRHAFPKLRQERRLPGAAPDNAKDKKLSQNYKHHAPDGAEDNTHRSITVLPTTHLVRKKGSAQRCEIQRRDQSVNLLSYRHS